MIRFYRGKGINWGWAHHRRHLDGTHSFNLRWVVVNWGRPRIRTINEIA